MSMPSRIKNPCAHFRAILGIAQRAGADGSDRLDTEIATTVAVLAQDRHGARFAGGADHAGLVDALTQAGDFGQIIQHAKAAGVSDIGNQAKNRVGADVDKGAAARAHGPAAAGVSAEFRRAREDAGFAQPCGQVGQGALRIIAFFALPRSRAASGGNRPKLTFIG